MGETEFQREVLNRLIRMETKQDTVMETVSEHSKMIADHSERIVKNEESTKSAHHRITNIWATAGVLGTLAGGAVNLISSIWYKGGGH